MKTRYYDWDQVQAYYDAGHSAKETAEKFGMSPSNLVYNKRFRTRSKEEQTRRMVETKKKNGTLGHSAETKAKLSKIAQKRGFGGKNYRKTFPYKGVLLESSYELAVARELDEHNIKWERPGRFYWVDQTGKQRHYTPDFYLPDYDVYLDPKNDYLIEVDSEKIKECSRQNNIKVLVLDKEELKWNKIADKVFTDTRLASNQE